MYCAENEWFSLVNFCGTEKLQKALITRFGLGFIENHLNFKASCMVHGKTIVIERSQVQVLRRSFFYPLDLCYCMPDQTQELCDHAMLKNMFSACRTAGPTGPKNRIKFLHKCRLIARGIFKGLRTFGKSAHDLSQDVTCVRFFM